MLERDSLGDFLYAAELKQQHFEAVKAPRLVVDNLQERQVVIDYNSNVIEQNTEQLIQEAIAGIGSMRIPRKPQWDGVRTGDEQKLVENTAFVGWRRKLADLQEKYRVVTLTPYEKNVELWKQLWRVVERSEIVI